MENEAIYPNNQSESNHESSPSAEQLVNQDNLLEKRKEKIKEKIFDWIKKPKNLLIVIIFIAIIFLRLYYFNLTINQAVWWDESEYLSGAKALAGIVKYQLHVQRLPGFSLMMSPFYMLGITNESILRFFFNFLPSVLSIFVFYFLIKEMYPDKRIALISTIIFGVLWEHLFYSNRFHTENISILFEFLALFILFRVYVKKQDFGIIKSKYSLILILIFSMISLFVRPGNLPFFPALVLFIILLNQPLFYHEKYKKYAWIFLIGLIVTSLFILLNLNSIPLLNAYYIPERPITFNSLTIFNQFYQSVVPNIPPVFFWAFLIGVSLSLINTFIIIDKIKRIKRDSNYMDFKSDIFNFLLFVFVFFLFIFLTRTLDVSDCRWFLLFLPAMLSFTSKGVILTSEFIGKLFGNKNFVLILIILVVYLGAYNQVVHADSIIKTKLNSYSQVREAGLWIRANSEKDDIVLSRSMPQTVYYSERETHTFSGMNESQFFELVDKVHPSFMLETVFEPLHVPEWEYQPTPEMLKIMSPVQVWYADPEQTQLIAIVYRINSYLTEEDLVTNLTGEDSTNSTEEDLVTSELFSETNNSF